MSHLVSADFMHQISFLMGGAYSASPYPIAVFKEPTSKGRRGQGEERKGKGKGRRREEREAH